MKELNTTELRALIRLIPALRSLRDDVEKSLHLEYYDGTGDLIVTSYRGLRDRIAALTDDPYIRTLEISGDQATSDREVAGQVLIAVGQLLAYVGSETGVSVNEEGSRLHVQTAPNINLDIGENFRGSLGRVMEMVDEAIRDFPHPPQPPQPPHPPHEHGPHARPRVRKAKRFRYGFRIEDDDDSV